jgi:hypothetical protein
MTTTQAEFKVYIFALIDKDGRGASYRAESWKVADDSRWRFLFEYNFTIDVPAGDPRLWAVEGIDKEVAEKQRAIAELLHRKQKLLAIDFDMEAS